MHPILFQLRLGDHDIALRLYGVFIALGFVVGVLTAMRAARRAGEDPDRMRDLAFYVLVAALFGSRLLYVATNWDEFARACPQDGVSGCLRALRLWEGGLVFYGGLAGAAVAAWGFARRYRVSFLALGDRVAPALAIGHVFGRLGCFFAGCCFGRASSAPWAMRFPRESIAYQDLVARGQLAQAADVTPPLHPTQLYEAVAELGIFLVLTALARRRKKFDGRVLLVYLGLYAIARAVIELFRGDAARRYLVALKTPSWNRMLGLDPSAPSLVSTSQAVSALLLAVVAVGYFTLARARPSAPTNLRV